MERKAEKRTNKRFIEREDCRCVHHTTTHSVNNRQVGLVCSVNTVWLHLCDADCSPFVFGASSCGNCTDPSATHPLFGKRLKLHKTKQEDAAFKAARVGNKKKVKWEKDGCKWRKHVGIRDEMKLKVKGEIFFTKHWVKKYYPVCSKYIHRV